MISYREATQILLNNIEKHTEYLPILSALGKISATEVTSSMNIPSFCNSAMDGFAVCSYDIKNASKELPITIPIVDKIAAGDIEEKKSENGVVQIMTGAKIPEGYDAVIPVEDVTILGSIIHITRPVRINENIRFTGEDVKTNQIVVCSGDVITSECIMLLAALGIVEIEVYRLPDIHILSTGKEITDNFIVPLKIGKIYNSNSPYLLARCTEEGLSASYSGIIYDDVKEFEKRISTIPEGSIIITTGAVSKGEWDFIPASLNKLGATIHFHRVNIRPGKPVLFATLPNGNFFFGLPGNPISTAIGFKFFVLPLIRSLQGLKCENPIMSRLENNITKKGNFRQFLKADLKIDKQGEAKVKISDGQESFKIFPMAKNNAWVVLEENRTEYKSGEFVPVYPYNLHTLHCNNLLEEIEICKIA